MIDKYLLRDLERIVGPTRLLTQKEDLFCYSYDATRLEVLPEAVVRVVNEGEISRIVKLANKLAFPLVPRGAGTGLSGGSVPVPGGVVLDLTLLDKILQVNAKDLWLRVQAGAVTEQVDSAASSYGLFYPPDPASYQSSTIGGNIAENAGGLRALKYGVTRNYVLTLKVVLPGGEIVSLGHQTLKDVAGYDLVSLFCGSEGTLGVIVEATLKLLPIPPARRSALATFTQLERAGQAVQDILSQGVIPATLEIMDRTTILAVEDYLHLGLPCDCEAILLVEVDGSEETVEGEIKEVLAALQVAKASSARLAQSEEEREELWQARRAALAALARLKPSTILEDITVPRSQISALLSTLTKIGQSYQLSIGLFGHAGDGNMHPTILTDLREEAEVRKVEAATKEMFEVALALGGTISGEHGIGLTNHKYLPLGVDPAVISVMREIKRSIDPQNVLNPGKIFP